MPNTTEYDTRLAIVENDVKQMGQLFDRMDTAIEKIADISNSVNQMLAVHEATLSTQGTKQNEIFALFETRRREVETSDKEIHSRITTQGRELQSEMKDDTRKVMESIDQLKSMLRNGIRESAEDVSKLEDRVVQLEQRQWLVMGGAIVVGFLIANASTILEMIS
jgi:hypothetical protein|tara:strand:- start:6787 stop:7281 length:495 start_codon:yes stop_codon:yes gene_type:complete